MSVFEIVAHGFRLVAASWKLVVLLWLLNIAVAAPAAMMLGDSLDDSFGKSLVAEKMRHGFDMDWHAELEARARGLEATFSPTLAGPGVILDNLEAWWRGSLFSPVEVARRPGTGQAGNDRPRPRFRGVVMMGLAYMLIWVFFLGGALDRLARPGDPPSLERLVARSGRYFPRFAGLAAISGAGYFLVYRLGRWLYRGVQKANGDVTDERVILVWIFLAAALVVLLLHLVRMIFDYAKIAIVLEERLTVFGGIWAGVRMILRQPLRTVTLYGGFAALALALVVAYGLAVPGAGPSSVLGIGLVFLLAQGYLVGRIFLRLGLLGSQLSLYRAAVSGG